MTRLETLAELAKLHRALTEDRDVLVRSGQQPYALGNALDTLGKKLQEVLDAPAPYTVTPSTPTTDFPF